jgi:hypothetical protein
VPWSALAALGRLCAPPPPPPPPPTPCSPPPARPRPQAADVDTGLLQDAARREAMEAAKVAADGGASARR